MQFANICMHFMVFCDVGTVQGQVVKPPNPSSNAADITVSFPVFLSDQLTFLSDQLTFLSDQLTFLSEKLTFLSSKLTFLSRMARRTHDTPVRYAAVALDCLCDSRVNSRYRGGILRIRQTDRLSATACASPCDIRTVV